MLKVGVHLDDVLDRKLDAPFEAVDPGDAATAGAGSVEDEYPARVLGRKLVGDAAGAVWRLVVRHDDAGVNWQRQDLLNTTTDRARFVIGWKHRDNAHGSLTSG
jgi:hypothetical protein